MVVALLPDTTNERLEVIIGGSGPKRAAKIGAAGGEQAGVELSFGRDARPRAGSAEWLGYRRDDTDLAGPIFVPVTLCNLTGIVGTNGLESVFGVDGGDNLRRGDHIVETPPVGVTDIHVLDEADDMTGAPEVGSPSARRPRR